MVKGIDSKLRHSIVINNRDITSGICINELNTLLERAELVQQRQFIQALIQDTERNVGSKKPINLVFMLPNIGNCKKCN